MGLFDFMRRKTTDLDERSSSTLTIDDYVNYFVSQGTAYPYLQTSLGGTPTEEVSGSFNGLIEGAYKANSVVYACISTRKRVFSEARLAYREVDAKGQRGDLFGDPSLERFEHPWTNGSTGDLMARAILDIDLAGNFYALRRPDGVQRLRPDWVTIVLGSKLEPKFPSGAPDMEVLGYLYKPDGINGAAESRIFTPDEIAHWAPELDPAANYRGMSWLQPLIREIMGDQAAMKHKLKFFDHGATPNMVVKMDPAVDKESFAKWIEFFRANHEGPENAYKTMFLGGGADASVIGADMKQIDFTAVQSHGEARIAAAAGVPAIIVGLQAGLDSATYSNFASARRSFADSTLHPLWRTFAQAMADIADVPPNAELWYDTTDIPFLNEDQKDLAEIQVAQAGAIKSLTEAGFTPETAVDAIKSGDLGRLEHSGLTSVQLLPPGQAAAPMNGNGNGNAAPAEEPRTAEWFAEMLRHDAHEG